MQSLRSSSLLRRSSGLTSFISIYPQWLHHTAIRYCNCSDPPPPPKPETLISKPPISQNKSPPDHRVIGNALDLFSTSAYSPGSHLFHPDGAHIFLKLQSFLRAQYAYFGFREVITPSIYKQSLWERSGHWENYQDDMFQVIGRGATKSSQEKQLEIGEDESSGLKPMNCPGHCLLFKSRKRSYRDLPIRYADFSPLHRNEISGALSGLTRGRRFHQDDGHIFCRSDQIGDEINKTLAFVKMVYETFGMGSYRLVLSTRPKLKFIGEVGEWDKAETQLREALDRSGREWVVNEGDGAFYGPKIDIILKDTGGFEHQTATIQLDFQLPKRFDLTYHGPVAETEVKDPSTNGPERSENTADFTPVIIHRAIMGSLERFMALFIEHCKGRWPFWLSPRQVIILTVSNNAELVKYASKVATKLSGVDGPKSQPRPLGAQAYVVDTDFTSRSVAKKIGMAKSQHYNLICVIGQKETAENTISVDIGGTPGAHMAVQMVKPTGYMSPEERQSIDHKIVELDEEQLARMMRLMCDVYL